MKNQTVSISVNGSYLSVLPSEGARLDKLVLDKTNIIDSFPVNFRTSFASSILFPFVNRLENGYYKIKDKDFSFDINLPPNAIHGLVYKEDFEIIEIKENINWASISLKYSARERHISYPFIYDLLVDYRLSEKDFSMSLEVVNHDNESMPFNFGWHPYFYTSDRNKSQLKFKGKNKYKLNDQLIPIGESSFDCDGFQSLEDKKFDDCFKLSNNEVELMTPEYHIVLNSNLDENYLQIYTPKQRDFIAIEPMTAIANSFNNKIGLQYLKAKENFKVEWKIKLL